MGTRHSYTCFGAPSTTPSCSPESSIFKSFDFVLLADRCTNDDDPDLCFLPKCIVAVAISQLDSIRRPMLVGPAIVQRGLNWSEYELSVHCHDGERRSSSWESSVKLRNLIQIVRKLHTAHQDYYDYPSFRTIFHNTLLSTVRRTQGAHHTSCGSSLSRCGTSLSGRCRTCGGIRCCGPAVEGDGHPFPSCARCTILCTRAPGRDGSRFFGDDG